MDFNDLLPKAKNPDGTFTDGGEVVAQRNEEFGKAVGHGIENIERGIQTAGEGFQSFAEDANEGVTDIGRDIEQGIGQGLENVKQGFENFGKDAGNFFDDAFEKMQQRTKMTLEQNDPYARPESLS